MADELIRTVHRHTMLAAIRAGEITSVVEILGLRPVAQESLATFRAHELMTPSGQSPAELTDLGEELLAEWDAAHGKVG